MSYYEEMVEGAAPDGSPKAKKIAAAIIKDMLDRRGLRQEFEACDDEIQNEILHAWVELVEKHL